MKRLILSIALLIAGISGIMSVDAKYYDASASEVYVCTGKYAKKYHNDYECKGLQKCSAEIITLTVEEAEKRGYTKCKICYY